MKSLSLIGRSNEAIASTDMVRNFSTYLKHLHQHGGKFVILNRNEPQAVMLNVHEFESILNEIQELRDFRDQILVD